MHPFRFGVVLESIRGLLDLQDIAARAEDAGFNTLLIRDHLVDAPFGAQLAPLTTLAVAATLSTTLRLGTLVIDNDFRHPAVLAKEIATLDLLSAGRVELGLGAGWLANEYEQSGISFDPPGTRIERLAESIAILKKLLAAEPATFHGKHYRIDGLRSFPASLQRPHPPILLGGGARRMLSLAGREADIVSVLTSNVTSGALRDDPAERSPDRVAEKVGWIRDAAGDRFPRIELSLFPDFVVTDDRRSAAAAIAAARGWTALAPEAVLAMPAMLIGDLSQIVDLLQQRRETLGFSYFVIGDADLEAVAPIVSRLANT
ncbi:MAG: TIGR03621 family F420-dependent LLM class oxidoreductase [Thermomicrobiales bacterium]